MPGENFRVPFSELSGSDLIDRENTPDRNIKMNEALNMVLKDHQMTEQHKLAFLLEAGFEKEVIESFAATMNDHDLRMRVMNFISEHGTTGLTLTQVGEALGVNINRVRDIINGKVHPRVKKLFEIASRD